MLNIHKERKSSATVPVVVRFSEEEKDLLDRLAKINETSKTALVKFLLAKEALSRNVELPEAMKVRFLEKEKSNE